MHGEIEHTNFGVKYLSKYFNRSFYNLQRSIVMTSDGNIRILFVEFIVLQLVLLCLNSSYADFPEI